MQQLLARQVLGVAVTDFLGARPDRSDRERHRAQSRPWRRLGVPVVSVVSAVGVVSAVRVVGTDSTDSTVDAVCVVGVGFVRVADLLGGLGSHGGARRLGVGGEDILGAHRAGSAPAFDQQLVLGQGRGRFAQEGQCLVCVLGALLRVAPRHGGYEFVHVGGQVRDQGRGRGNVLVDVAEGDLDGGVGDERLLAGEQFIDDDAYGEHVCAGAGGARGDQLGSEIGHRSQDIARGGLCHFSNGPGQSEVGDLRN